MECNTLFSGYRPGFFHQSEVMHRYFERVRDAEKRVFGNVQPVERCLPIGMGDLNYLPMKTLEPVLDADVYVVFGSSWIQGALCDFLIQNGALNLHMGIAPEYRGSSCNFWAVYDGNPIFVGATVHALTSGLDSGPIFGRVRPPVHSDVFLRGMLAVKVGQELVLDVIRGLPSQDPLPQDRSLVIRYSRAEDFTDEVAGEFLDKH